MVGSRLVAIPQLSLGLLVAIAAWPGCGMQGRPEPSPEAQALPVVVLDALTADIAGNGERLWVVVSGRDVEGVTLSALELGADGWRQLPDVSRKMVDGHPVAVSRLGAVPCISYSEAGGARLRCHRGGRWVPLSAPPPVRRGATIAGMERVGGRLTALTRMQRGRSARHRVWRWERDGRWTPLGGPLASRGLVALGESGGAPALVVQVPAGRAARRVLRRYGDGRWSIARLPRFRYGPQVSGAVSAGARTFVAVNGASGSRWPFAVVVDGRRGPILNRGPGHAQGIVGAARGTVWALWQQHRPRGDETFDARVFAQDVARPDGRPRLLWSGRSIGPGALAIAEARGAAWALYLRAGREPGTLQPALARLGESR